MIDKVDTMTPAQLAEAWARMLGLKITLWDAETGDLFVEIDGEEQRFDPVHNWHHGGMCYEWIQKEGWDFTGFQYENRAECYLRQRKHPHRQVYVTDPDFRRAMLLAGWKAEGGRRVER